MNLPVLSVALSLALLAISGCAPEPVAQKVDPPRPVRSLVVEPRQLASSLTLPGEVRPRIETRYAFRVGGKIAERNVSVGDRVAAGKVLAKLDPADVTPAIDAGLAQAQANRTEVALASVELRRLKDLRERNYISQAQLDRQQAAFDSASSRLQAAEAQLRQARNALAFQVLAAGAPGVVTAVDAEAGQVVSSGQTVVRIAQTGEPEIAVNIPESDLAAVREARGWTVLVPALGRSLPARLRELSPVADPGSRTFPARLALSGDLRNIELGMTAVVQANRPTGQGYLLPLSSLQSKDGLPRVWVVDPSTSTVQPVLVQTAGFVDDAVRVVSGLGPGDRVVTAGANLLVPGQKVRLVDDASTRPLAGQPVQPVRALPVPLPAAAAASRK
jgi:membrane fusion protein, multidrug efflux system